MTDKDWKIELPNYSCCVSPENEFHEVGCRHKEWTKEELWKALDNSKRNEEMKIKLLQQVRDEGREEAVQEIQEMDLRLILTGEKVGLPLDAIMYLLGKKETIRRINKYINLLS